MVKLGDICQLISGYAFKSDLFTTNTSDLRVLKIKNIKDQKVVFDESDDRYVYTDKLEKFIVKENEFVVAMTGATTGKVGIHTSNEKVLLNQRVGKFSNFKDNIIPQYVYYYIRDNPNLFMDLAGGTARDNISPDQILSVQIPLPSLERQQQIVEAIDGWTNLAQNEEVSLKMLEKQIMFQVKEMGRGQARVKLGEICEFFGGKAVKKEDRSETGTIPYYGSNGITGFMDTSIFDGRYIITGQDGTLGTFYNVDGKFWASNHTHILRPKELASLQHDFLYYSLNVNFDVDKIQTGSCIPKITLTNIKDVEIPLPPLTEQQTLQSDFDEIRHKHAKIATYKAKAQEAIQRLIPGAT